MTMTIPSRATAPEIGARTLLPIQPMSLANAASRGASFALSMRVTRTWAANELPTHATAPVTWRNFSRL